ncbi:Cell division protein FtsH [hydrothermal vent metagenome]|uniref:Cell division protein FtsH n=1 Tax=hydrothermal vent metagenome TaxID=652676 RepID=A0A3B1DPP4_9ZZZZ
MKKFLIYIRIHWLLILIIAFIIGIIGLMSTLLYLGITSYNTMEPFAKRQIMAMQVIYLPMGIIQAFIFVFFIQIAQHLSMNSGMLSRLGREKMTDAKSDVKWDDVIGMENAKKEAWEIVKLLKDRHLLKKIGGKIVKGTMMIGPPGCGKTYLAKAIAAECGMPLLSAVGSEFVGMFVGQGASQMKALFKQARSKAELEGGCIIFIDEIDSFARPRMADTGFGGGISHNATINQFLTELDGLRKKENNIVVIAATNFGEQDLDPAIMRAGRFDRKIYITKPNLKEREDLFKFYLKRIKADPEVNASILARRALWYTPSDIDSMVREAGIISLREKREKINMKDLSEAYDRVTYGNKSNINMSDEDKKWTAYHETGHAILAYLTHPKDDVVKATIIPRKGFLGFVSHKPSEEHYSHNREYFSAQIKISIASYVAEEMTFGSTTSGVGGGPGADFNTAINIARQMVWSYGMGKSGYIGDYGTTGSPCNNALSDKIKEILEDDVQDLLQTNLKEVRDILTQHKDLLEYFAQELLKKEELEYDEIQSIFNKFNVKPLSGRTLKIS